MSRRLWIAPLLAALLPVLPATAADELPAAEAVQARRAGFKKMGGAMRFINDQLKGESPDLARMSAAAADLVRLSPEVARWFPAGSGADEGFDTDALDYVWKQRAKFDELTARLVTGSKALADALAGGDMTSVRTQVRTVGENCGACHKSFRAD
jgi:cytochrome c556